MFHYLLKRILLFIPILILISLLAFVISVNAPGDPVERLLTSAESGDMAGTATSAMKEEKIYWTHRLGLDLPVFYLSLTPLSYPDTLYKIIDRRERISLKRLIDKYGKWPQIQAYHQAIQKLLASHDKLIFDSSLNRLYPGIQIREAINESKFTAISLLESADSNIIRLKIQALESLYSSFPFFKNQRILLTETTKEYNRMISTTEKWKNYIPAFHFYPHNQYHRWLVGDGNWLTAKGSTFSKGLIRGDLGMSYTTKMPVTAVIRDRIGWSLFFTLISVILAYLVSIPVGIYSAVRHGSMFDRSSSVFLFMLHSMPSFWVGTLLLIFFANPDMLHWFPASGVKPAIGYPEGAGFLERARLSLPYLVLPVITYTYSSLAFLSRITRVSMLEIVNKDYIRTARAKGLPEYSIVYKHAFRNSLMPLITVFANIFPAVIGGSIILETIFTIPGMGLETYQAIQTQNYPVIVGVFTLTGVLTLIGYLIADLFYALADPRISLSKK